MNKLVLIVAAILLFSCKSIHSVENRNAVTVTIDTLLQDKISIRALALDHDKVWYAADQSRFGFIDMKTNQKKEIKLPSEKKSEIRSIAQTENYVFILNVGNPALLYKISKEDLSYVLVYQENHEKVFYDSMQFWNEKEGIAIGDPIEGSFSVITTRDGGVSWQKMPSDRLPHLEDGEAAFAASNTNIVIKGNATWLVSGGKKARVFHSRNKGKSWSVVETPIVQGKQMTGIFTADFYNSSVGFISGGNYEVLNQNFDNKAVTHDGGKTWKLVAQNQGFGYASCVQYIPNSHGKGLISVGASGIYYSEDGGSSWKQWSTDSSLYTIRLLNDNTAIAAGKNKVIRIRFK
ncbi:MAG: hypothetical protein RLZZ479_342 [Bacteroidota bacterium]|jgi:photosystem II stability/assembly factor-like uncharacterized protein